MTIGDKPLEAQDPLILKEAYALQIHNTQSGSIK